MQKHKYIEKNFTTQFLCSPDIRTVIEVAAVFD